jgi:hypothetical protein
MIAGEKVKQGLIPLKIKQVRPQQNRMQNRVRMHFARKLSSGVTSWPRIPLPKVKKRKRDINISMSSPFCPAQACIHAAMQGERETFSQDLICSLLVQILL